MRNRILFLCLLALILPACGREAPVFTPEPDTPKPGQTPLPVATVPLSPTEVSPSSEAPPSLPTATLELIEQPGPQALGDMVYHQGLGLVVMMNGTEDNRLWGWDGAAWRVVGEEGPDGRTSSGIAYDPERDKVVFYGGRSIATGSCVSDTWEWDSGGWQELDVPGPDACSHFIMEYDHALGQVLLFGGGDAAQNIFTDMWGWDGRQWQQLESQTPTPRFHAMSAADEEHENIFLIGGFDINNQMFDEMWAWDGAAWEQLDLDLPPALSHARMAFDSNRVQLVLFGGSTRARLPLDLQDETWILTGGAWQQAAVDGPTPSPRGGHAMAYDPLRDRVVLFGGFDADDEPLADTWEWDGANWACVDGCGPSQETIFTPAQEPGIALYRGDAQRTGVYDFPAIPTLPELMWQADTTQEFFDNLMLYDGNLYVGSVDGDLYAYDALTGEELWHGGAFRMAVSAVAIAGDVIIAGDFINRVQALNRHTGEEIWRVEVSGCALAPPLTVDGRVYIAASNTLYTLDLETGEALWSAPLPSENQCDFVSAPAYEAGRVYLTVGTVFLALDSETGAEIWRVEKETQFFFSALGQLAYVGNEDGFFYAYDLATGEEIWTFEGGSELWFGPAVTEDAVYVGHFNGFMYALDSLTGKKQWEFDTGNWAVSNAVVSDGALYFSNCNHQLPQQECRLFAVEAETGTMLWEYVATGTLLSTPVIGEGVIYTILSTSVLALR